MRKIFLKFILVFAIILISVIIFLSYFGLETDKFDSLIKTKANEINKYVKIGFKNTKIYLNTTELNLVVKLQNPRILVKKNEIILSKLDFYLPLRSFLTSDFLITSSKYLEVSISVTNILASYDDNLNLSINLFFF